MATIKKGEIKCAFCNGTGKDPFELLSKLSSCQVCGGKGVVIVKEPTTKCLFCKGTGVQPYTTNRLHCSVCAGKGVITEIKPSQTCPACGGGGIEPRRTIDATAPFGKVPCHKCRGKGFIPVFKEKLKKGKKKK